MYKTMKTIYRLLLSLTILVFVTSCEDAADVFTFNSGTINHFTSSSGSLGAKSSADTYSIEIGTTTSAAATVQLGVDNSSTAIEGIHFEAFPASVSIGQGEFVTSLTIVPIVEGITPGEPVTLVVDITNSTIETGMPQSFTLSLDRICDPYPGDWSVVMHDSYGDGWQTNDGNGGDGIQVTLDDGTVLEVGLCNPYVEVAYECTPNDGFEGTGTITIPVGTKGASWYFPGDQYGEISFEIYGPEGSLIYTSPLASDAGILPVVLCAP